MLRHCPASSQSPYTTVFSIEELRCVIWPDVGALCQIEELTFVITPISRVVTIFRHN